jgi:hypothetical protein
MSETPDVGSIESNLNEFNRYWHQRDRTPSVQTTVPIWVVVNERGVFWAGRAKDEYEAWGKAMFYNGDEIQDCKQEGWYAAPAVVTWETPRGE